MLEAFIHNKLNRAISEGVVHPIEDTLTSSVIGTLQFLPDEMFWKILSESCGLLTKDLPAVVGNIIAIDFWEKLDSSGTSNKRFVEPDVIIETEQYYIIIEAKRADSECIQNNNQWYNEIVSILNLSRNLDKKDLVFRALGGNDTYKDKVIDVQNRQFIIHTASWFNLLNSVVRFNESLGYTENTYIKRILYSVIRAFEKHHIIKMVWFDSLDYVQIDYKESLFNQYLKFQDRDFFKIEDFKIQIENIDNIWKLIK